MKRPPAQRPAQLPAQQLQRPLYAVIAVSTPHKTPPIVADAIMHALCPSMVQRCANIRSVILAAILAIDVWATHARLGMFKPSDRETAGMVFIASSRNWDTPYLALKTKTGWQFSTPHKNSPGDPNFVYAPAHQPLLAIDKISGVHHVVYIGWNAHTRTFPVQYRQYLNGIWSQPQTLFENLSISFQNDWDMELVEGAPFIVCRSGSSLNALRKVSGVWTKQTLATASQSMGEPTLAVYKNQPYVAAASDKTLRLFTLNT